MKVVINRCYGIFGLSEEAYNYLGLEWEGSGFKYNRHEKRADPKLVECVETLGSERASGKLAELKVVEIPDDICWEISEYDGMETIEEVHNSWR